MLVNTDFASFGCRDKPMGGFGEAELVCMHV